MRSVSGIHRALRLYIGRPIVVWDSNRDIIDSVYDLCPGDEVEDLAVSIASDNSLRVDCFCDGGTYIPMRRWDSMTHEEAEDMVRECFGARCERVMLSVGETGVIVGFVWHGDHMLSVSAGSLELRRRGNKIPCSTTVFAWFLDKGFDVLDLCSVGIGKEVGDG